MLRLVGTPSGGRNVGPALKQLPSTAFYFLLPTSLAAYLGLGYLTERTDFPRLILLYGFLFVAYAALVRVRTPAQFRAALAAALVFRLSLLVTLPNLSDDYFRFVWDGRLLTHGVNPYLVLPKELIGTPVATHAGLDPTLLGQLNSPAYYTVYPPLHQAVSAVAVWAFPRNLTGSVVVMRLFILLAEAGTVYLLIRLLERRRLPQTRVLLYALNPLVVMELTGNLHLESVMVFFLLGAVYALPANPDDSQNRSRNRPRNWSGLVVSAFRLALAIGTKLIPLVFLPLLWKSLGFRRGLVYCAVVGGLLLAMAAPFISPELAVRFGSSVGLYFRKFEFNASVYYLVREWGYWWHGYNIIGTAGADLSRIALAGILAIAYFSGPDRSGGPARFTLPVAMLFSLTLYYALATTVHPWYITTLVALSTLTPYRFALVWSALLPLTYFTYRTPAYRENLGLVALEYALVFGYLIYELVCHWKSETRTTETNG